MDIPRAPPGPKRTKSKARPKSRPTTKKTSKRLPLSVKGHIMKNHTKKNREKC